MKAQIFVQFEDRLKRIIEFSSEGYVIPERVFYGFTNDKEPGHDTIWYNLNGNPGSEVSNDLYKRSIKELPPIFIYEGFRVKVNPYITFKKIIYRVRYCYKYRDSNQYDVNNYSDAMEVYYCPAPTRDFWEAVTY
ncbi:MAG TPA: hypothetical protein PL110_09275 [Candidatus Eremiobacteraeota bacterium]|nr:MAG: hypothetical protein BWY64_00158 [bacterium ADurb.Bin363]HPZ08293.1 hypothetical protein [Candidatus Eremiobacteraeota bacterium]